jgi:hypothetical protein
VLLRDLDSDGDMDVIVLYRTEGVVAWHENDGSESFVEHNISSSPFGSPRNFQVKDINGDGDNDIVVGDYDSNTITWLENDGSENFTEHILTDMLNDVETVELFDIDKDGDMDIISTSYDDETIVWFENNLSIKTTPNTAITLSNSNPYAISINGESFQNIDVNISASYASVTLGQSTGITFMQGDGSSDSVIQMNGALSDINSTLNGMVVSTQSDYSGGEASVDINISNGSKLIQQRVWIVFEDTIIDQGEESASNNAATGVPTITGPMIVGQMVTANTADIDDLDGLGTFSYQWYNVSDEANISGATSKTFTLSNDEVGDSIKVIVSFVDGVGNHESIHSNATSFVRGLALNTNFTFEGNTTHLTNSIIESYINSNEQDHKVSTNSATTQYDYNITFLVANYPQTLAIKLENEDLSKNLKNSLTLYLNEDATTDLTSIQTITLSTLYIPIADLAKFDSITVVDEGNSKTHFSLENNNTHQSHTIAIPLVTQRVKESQTITISSFDIKANMSDGGVLYYDGSSWSKVYKNKVSILDDMTLSSLDISTPPRFIIKPQREVKAGVGFDDFNISFEIDDLDLQSVDLNISLSDPTLLELTTVWYDTSIQTPTYNFSMNTGDYSDTNISLTFASRTPYKIGKSSIGISLSDSSGKKAYASSTLDVNDSFVITATPSSGEQPLSVAFMANSGVSSWKVEGNATASIPYAAGMSFPYTFTQIGTYEVNATFSINGNDYIKSTTVSVINPDLNITLHPGVNYVSFPTKGKLEGKQINNLFDNKGIISILKNNGKWSYWTSIPIDKAVFPRFNTITSKDGLIINATTTVDIAFPFDVLDNDADEFINLRYYDDGWYLIGVNENKSPSDIASLVQHNSNNTKVLKEIKLYRYDETTDTQTMYFYTPDSTYDATVKTSIPRLNTIYKKESFWIRVE